MSFSRRSVGFNARAASVAKMTMAIAGVALSVAGCATDEEYRREVYARQQAMHSAMVAQRAIELDVEDDGLPSQVPPPAHRKPEADDPREPYSRNYGSPTYGSAAHGKTAAASQRTTLPPEPADAPPASRRVAAN